MPLSKRSSQANRIKSLIVDDEPLGRERIRVLLAPDPRFEVVAECAHGREAVAAIRSMPIELAFLDIQMPEMSGVEVVQEIGPEAMPPVIFVTAYDAYAIKAFEMHAFDYLLKPFTVERFAEALDRAAERIALRDHAALSRQLSALIQDMPAPASWAERIMVKSRSKIYFVLTRDIDWIEAAGNYISIHAGGKTHLLRQTMASLEKQLDPVRFMRIHRSTIVNMDRVHQLHPMASGEYEVLLVDGTKLTMSRSYKDHLDRFS